MNEWKKERIDVLHCLLLMFYSLFFFLMRLVTVNLLCYSPISIYVFTITPN